MEHRQYQLINATLHRHLGPKDRVHKYEVDLNVLVKLLINKKLLTETNTVVKKQTVRDVFQERHDMMPNLKHSEVGEKRFLLELTVLFEIHL